MVSQILEHCNITCSGSVEEYARSIQYIKNIVQACGSSTAKRDSYWGNWVSSSLVLHKNEGSYSGQPLFTQKRRGTCFISPKQNRKCGHRVSLGGRLCMHSAESSLWYLLWNVFHKQPFNGNFGYCFPQLPSDFTWKMLKDKFNECGE